MARKIIKVQIGKDRSTNRLIYPKVWRPKEVDANTRGLHYDLEGDPITVVALMKGDLADRYVAGGNGKISELTTVQAQAWIDANSSLRDLPTELVTDSDRMLAIIAKILAGLTATAEDLAALDPDDASVRGITRRPRTPRGLFGDPNG